MNGSPSEQGAISLAERIFTVLDEGRFSATYKYAVLIALIDLCMEGASRFGAAPDTLNTGQLAKKIVHIYWRQCRPYEEAQPSPRVLRQISGPKDSQAEIVAAIAKFRALPSLAQAVSLSQARSVLPEKFASLIDFVEWKLIEFPLARLQRLGSGEDRFLYDLGWEGEVPRAEVVRYQRGEPSTFDNRIHLKARTGDYLVQLNALLRPLIYRDWSNKVADLNNVPHSPLEPFLFGVEREPLGAVRDGLAELQRGRCFYCERDIGAAGRNRPQVDHFIPWSRYPDNAIENLVIAHEGCNGAKRHFLAAAEHVAAWRARFQDQGQSTAMAEVAARASWERRPEILNVARAIYFRLPESARLWRGGRAFVTIDRDALDAALS